MDRKLKAEIEAILAEAKDLTIATLRPDGWPQATTVSFASDGLDIFVGCGADSQKARNLTLDSRVSITVNLPYRDWSEIRGLSLAGRAHRLTSEDALAKAGLLFMGKFPEVAQYVKDDPQGLAMFRIEPVVISVLDYRLGFGHTELVPAVEPVA